MIKWERMTHQYTNGWYGYLGKYRVFALEWDSCMSKGEEKPPYKLTTKLPGLKPILGNYEGVDDAGIKAENVLNYWIEGTGLREILNESHS